MSRYAFKKYTPVEVEDADGGGTVETLSTYIWAWGDVNTGSAETVITTDINELVTVGDVFIIEGAQYRAIAPEMRKPGTQQKSFGLERVNMPIEPIA